jgi:preprotein translocase subunit SecE
MAKTNPAQFVRQVRQEMNRITWATKRETMFASMSVFVMALIASAFFFSC